MFECCNHKFLIKIKFFLVTEIMTLIMFKQMKVEHPWHALSDSIKKMLLLDYLI